MSLATDPLLTALPADRPEVERVARIPRGFLAAGARAGIKPSGNQDLALVAAVADAVPAAAVFTPNRLAAAPVRLTRANLQATGGTSDAAGYAKVIVATSGSANAATGPGGDADQAAIGEAVALALGTTARHVLHLSTGVIGVRLPAGRVATEATRLAREGLSATDASLESAAVSLRTTDTTTKMATVTIAAPAATGAGTVDVT